MRAELTALLRDRLFLRDAGLAGAIFAVAVAIPTQLISTPVFYRPIPVEWWEYVVLAVAAPLAGIAYALSKRRSCGLRRTTAGGVAAFIAVGCPTCNALVVAAIGASGALQYFAPVQPFIGVAAIILLLAVVRSQLKARTEPVEPATEAEANLR